MLRILTTLKLAVVYGLRLFRELRREFIVCTHPLLVKRGMGGMGRGGSVDLPTKFSKREGGRGGWVGGWGLDRT